MQNPLVTALYVYPVKSMKGIALSSAVLTSKALTTDWEKDRPGCSTTGAGWWSPRTAAS